MWNWLLIDSECWYGAYKSKKVSGSRLNFRIIDIQSWESEIGKCKFQMCILFLVEQVLRGNFDKVESGLHKTAIIIRNDLCRTVSNMIFGRITVLFIRKLIFGGKDSKKS